MNTTGLICQYGCWDEEDEACHTGLNAPWRRFFFFGFGESLCDVACWLHFVAFFTILGLVLGGSLI